MQLSVENAFVSLSLTFARYTSSTLIASVFGLTLALIIFRFSDVYCV